MAKKEFNQAEYINDYKKDHYKNYSFRFNLESEKEIIDFLEKQENKKKFVKDLILEAINNQKIINRIKESK